MELRKDYILDYYVIISQRRASRPDQFKAADAQQAQATLSIDDERKKCIFCPGNEPQTPPEKGRIGTRDLWSIRWFDNKYAAEEPTGKFSIQTDNKYYTFSDAYGYHEVIAETNDHARQIYDLNVKELSELLGVYQARIRDLSAKEHIKYVHVFKNHGKEAGTSIKHSHTQIIAFNHIPLRIQDELNAVKRYESCPYCEIIVAEKNSYRRCFENNSFVAFTPYASRFNYEIWIFPKQHHSSITRLPQDQLKDLSEILHNVLAKLKDMGCAFNFFIHNTPEYLANDYNSLHFHIEITPRTQIWAGIEDGSETFVNNISPEDAARFYRGE